jgi:hypothetical protein
VHCAVVGVSRDSQDQVGPVNVKHHGEGTVMREPRQAGRLHTTLVLRLIPLTVTPHILWLLLLMSLVAKHLIEEAELQTRRDEPCT